MIGRVGRLGGQDDGEGRRGPCRLCQLLHGGAAVVLLLLRTAWHLRPEASVFPRWQGGSGGIVRDWCQKAVKEGHL